MNRRTGLTRRQADLLDFIVAHTAKHGVSPSFDEMAAGVGAESKSTICRLVEALAERGAIRRLRSRARAIEIVDREPSLPPELERRVTQYCRAVQIDRPEFEKRAAEGLLRGWA